MKRRPPEDVSRHQRPVVEGSTLHLSEILGAGGALLQTNIRMGIMSSAA